MLLDPTILLVASLTFFIGGLSKGAMGFGLPLIAIPLLTAFGSLPLALSIAVPPVVATNFWQFWKFRRHREVSFMPRFLVAGVVGVLIGAFALKSIEDAYLEIILGSLVLFYLLSRSRKRNAVLTPKRQVKLAPYVGGLAGAVHGSMGLSGLIGTPFFHASSLARPAFIFNNSAMFTVFSVLHIPALATVGLYQSSALLIGLIAMLPAFAGLWIGSFLGERLQASTLPILVQGMLTISAVLPIWNGITHLTSS